MDPANHSFLHRDEDTEGHIFSLKDRDRMTSLTSKFAMLAVLASALTAGGSAGHAQSAVFADLSGKWAGNGSIQLEDGSTERIRCRATYAVSGPTLTQSLTCASDSYRFELRSNVAAKGNALSGNWSEVSRNVSGELTGRASNGRYDVTVSSPVFTANLALTVQGNRQNVSISSRGEFRGVTISMTKS